MARYDYNSYTGEKSNGDNEFGFAGAYITSQAGNYSGLDTATEPQPWQSLNYRRFFGSDKSSGGHWYYTYCSFAVLPKGTDLKINLSITGQNSYFGGGTGDITMLVGYSLTKPVGGANTVTGKNNSPTGLVVKEFKMPITSSSSSSNTTGSVEIELPDSYSGKKVYFYFWGKDATKIYSCFPFRGLAGFVTYTEYTPVSTPAIKSISPKIISSDGSVEISIEPSLAGINNAVKQYKIYYSNSGIPTNSSKFIAKRPNLDNIIKVFSSEMGSPAAGSKIYLGIQGVGEISGYDSELSTNNEYYVIINSAPTKPQVELYNSIVSNNGEDEVILIKTISSVDADNDILTYYYALSNSSLTPTTGWLLIPDSKELICNSSRPYVHFKAYDGNNYSTSSYIKLSVNSGPDTIGVATVSGDGYIGYDGDYYTRTITAKATGSNEYVYDWEYRYGINGTWDSLGRGKTISKTLKEGFGKIYIRFTATDKFGDTKTIDAYNTGLRYLQNWTTSQIQITTYQLQDCQSFVNAEEYSRDMSIKFNFTQMTENDAKISKVGISLEKTDGSVYISHFYNDIMNDKNIAIEKIKNIDLRNNSTLEIDGGILTIRFYAENLSGDTFELYKYTQSIKLLPLLTSIFGEDLTEEQKIINLDIVNTNSGIEQIYVRYSDAAKIANYIVWFSNKDMPTARDVAEYTTFEKYNDSSAILSFPDPRGLFQSLLLKSEKDYTGNVAIGAKNILGESYFLPTDAFLATFFIKATAPSVFMPLDGNTAPYIMQYTSQTSSKPEGYHNPDWSQSTIEDVTRMFNPDEYIYFDTKYQIKPQMDVYFDGTGGAPISRIGQYTYDISYTVINENSAPNKDSDWISVPQWQNLTYLDMLKVPSTMNPLIGPERIYFRIQAKDEYNIYVINESKNNEDSLYVTDSSQYLLWCRKVEPVIKISECRKEGENYLVRFKIDDFGGNNKGYDNFARSQNLGVGENIDGAMKIAWNCGSTLQTLTEADAPPIYERISSLENEAREFDFGNLNNLTGRIYIQATITFYYNSVGDTLTTQTQVYVIYTETPTVAYRSHQIGINAQPDNILFEDDVLIISDFSNKRYVRLIGLDGLSETEREILIDLKTGAISGLVIDGGTW